MPISKSSSAQPPIDRLQHIRGVMDGMTGRSTLSQLLLANFSSYLPDDLLVKADRCTMANSLEARSPFLDRALIEYVATLPDSYKLDGARTKAILRDAFTDLIPAEIDQRPKTGFGVPLDAWFRGELREPARDLLLSSNARYRDFISPDVVQRTLTRHDSGAANEGQRLWALSPSSAGCSCSRRSFAVPFRQFPHDRPSLAAAVAVVRASQLAMVPLCRATAIRLGYVAKPREDRWHRRPVALLGGVGIGVTLLVMSLVSGVATQVPVLRRSVRC